MGIVFRQSAKTSIVVFSGALLGAFVIWLSTKFITDKQQFGFIRNITTQALSLSQILLFGLSSTLFIYSHRYPDDVVKRKALFTICLGLPIIFTALFSIALFFLKSEILLQFQPADRPLIAKYFIWIPIYSVFFIYMAILEQYLAFHMKVAISAFMREIILRILNIIIILLYAFGMINFNTLVIALILIYLVPILVFLSLCFHQKEVGFSLNFNAFSRAEYRDMFQFTWYHFFWIIAVMLMNGLDQLLLPVYDHSGLLSNAVYSVAVYIISFLQMPSKAFLPATFSVLTTAFAENDLPKAKDIFVRSSLNILIPTVGIAVVLCCNLGNAVDVIGNGKNYSGMSAAFLILLIGQMVNLSTGINDQVISITNYYKFTVYLSLILTIVLFILLRLLVPEFGLIGAAWSTTITISIYNIAKFIFIWKKLDMQPYSKNSLIVVLAGLPALAAGYYLPHFFSNMHHIYIGTFIDAALRSLIIIIIYLTALLWLRPSADLDEYVATIRKNKRLF